MGDASPSTASDKPQPSVVVTRFLVLSDTHGRSLPGDCPPADVALHCGDLTEGSTLVELRAALDLLTGLDAPLKLVVAGNHDFTLDEPAFRQIVAGAWPPLKPEEVRETYGAYGEAAQVLRDARKAGVHFLDEGTHRFVLASGATLTVYASPYTPALGDGAFGGGSGFQYGSDVGHTFVIEAGTDVVMTHGPPRGVLDRASSGGRVGCPQLFAAVASSRPALHCFGHVHRGRGAELVTWRAATGNPPCHFAAIDHARTVRIRGSTRLPPRRTDDDVAKEKHEEAALCASDRCCRISRFTDGKSRLLRGEQTLFVNAAMKGGDDEPLHFPWLVDIELGVANR